MRQPNRVGGGARTNCNGLQFEQTSDLRDLFASHPDFVLQGDCIKKDGKLVAILCGKNDLYKKLLVPSGVDYHSIISKRLVPDEAVLVGKTVYIIEKKFQSGVGSVDEKLQTCDFKKKQYAKLLATVGLEVEYIYYLCDWFKRNEYKDVLEYIRSVGCKYFFDEIPLNEIGL